jgi:hypothetical protein
MEKTSLCNTCCQKFSDIELYDKYEVLVRGTISPFPHSTSPKCKNCMQKHLGVKIYDYETPEFGRVNFKKYITEYLCEIKKQYDLGIRKTDI